MREKSNPIDWMLKRAMAVAGAVLIVLLLGRAAGLPDFRQTGMFHGNKIDVAGYLLEIWHHSYPAANAVSKQWNQDSEEKTTGWSRLWLMKSPVYRFLEKERKVHEETMIKDPAYAAYLENRTFYQEHEYLLLYGDEESKLHQAEAPVTEPVPIESAPAEAATGGQGVRPVTGVTGVAGVTGTEYVMEQLADYDFLMKHFYSVHTSTTATREEMKAEELLGKDLSIVKDESQPQILIYHTHSQETYADYGPDNPGATVVGVGDYLTRLLQAKGYQVIHHTQVYDLKNGELDRSKAYTYALDGINGVLQQYPSIQVVLDLHRDGVREGVHMVSEVNGKQTAQIMFFNGMSQTPEGDIESLQNPYKEDNLAFSLQMQLKAAAYYPGLTRKIYLKGLRYNLHVRPRTSLVEVGAQTNTYEEALNAMEPLAELLDMVLQGP